MRAGVSPSGEGDPLRAALAYLRQHHVMTLATSSPDGAPWAATLFYACQWPDGPLAPPRLVFVSKPDSRHGRYLADAPRCAAAVDEPYRDVRTIRGIQLEGQAYLLAPDERPAALATYLARFPELAPYAVAQTGHFRLAGRDLHVSLFGLSIVELYWIDNARAGFGRRRVWPPPAPAVAT